MKLSQIKNKTITVEGIEFECRPVSGKHILPYGETERQKGNDFRHLIEILHDVLVGWNLEGEDGTKMPITEENILLLPAEIITELSKQVMGAKVIPTAEQGKN